MSRMRTRCTLALGLLAAGISPAFSQTIKAIREAVEAAARDGGFNGEVEQINFHDLRRTLVTWMQRMSCDKELRDAVTNHKVTSGADASYAHAQRLPDQRAILKQWAEFVEEA